MDTLIKGFIISVSIILLQSCFGGASKTPDNEMSFHGVYFKYPSYWKSETEVVAESAYYIKCEERFSSGTMLLVSFFEGESEPAELLMNYLDGVNESSERVNVTTKFFSFRKYGNYDCQMVNYEISALTTKSYGNAYTFNAGGKTLLVVEQSERHYDLKHDKFKNIQNSFIVDQPVDTSLSEE
ncbi:MAG: hypothetical protein LBV72_07235 [Tannerella sp.]|jgi:hypothetical protein|nr:hypothetical protein [Tannerella sp.]